MAMSDLEKATDFLRGVAEGDPDLATRHVDPDAFIEHDPERPDGALDFWKHVDGKGRTSILNQRARVLQDEPFVVVQHDAGSGGGMVVFEVFRFDGGRIVEHWRFSSVDGAPNKSGHTQLDGPTEPLHLDDTEANKGIVRSYYETVHLGGRHDEARRWFKDDLMIRHEPGVADGADEFLQDLSTLVRGRTIDGIKILAGQGDLVFIVARGTYVGAPCAYVDLYRAEDGKVVEHWGFPQTFPTGPTLSPAVDFL